MTNRQAKAIRLKGVRQNNLKGFDVDVPLGKLIVVTGLSGAGKSSLVFETLHAEGQRRYVETFSAYTRQFMEMLDRPDVDEVENIRPSIAIEQSNTVKTSRSTVGTMTELCDYFKVWFPHMAELHDPATGKPIREHSPQSIWKAASAGYAGQALLLAFSVSKPENFAWEEVLHSLTAQGYSRVILHGELANIADIAPGATLPGDSLSVIQDRMKIATVNRSRFIEAVETALHFGHGAVELFALDTGGGRRATFAERFVTGLRSPVTGETFKPARPALFSFNSPIGACPECRGFGRVVEIDYRLVIPDTRLSLEGGAIRAFQGSVYSESRKDLLRACKRYGIPVDVPYRELSKKQQAFVIEGEPGFREEDNDWTSAWYGVRRFFQWLEENTYKMHVRVFLSRYRAYTQCPACGGARLQPEALRWKWKGRTLPELYAMPIDALHELLGKHTKGTADGKRGNKVGADQSRSIAIENILTRLGFMNEVGLGYLTLDRSSRTLSGGEVERVNLTSCLGTGLVDTLFVLDEPSVGLHARDIDRLIGILRQLTEQGNTVIVVEHDESVMRAADHIMEIGPRPGSEGGNIIYSGSPDKLAKAKGSVTADYLLHRKSIEAPKKPRPVGKSAKSQYLRFREASKHNIDGLDVALPLHRFVALSGVSGSGKSTLLNNVIYQGLMARRGRAVDDPASIASIDEPPGLQEIVLVDQSPVSRTPRSSAALYSEAWDGIRNLFAATEAARSQGMTASSFSFNSGNGRCPNCEGLGHERVEMQFMADVFVTCPVCHGRRFTPEVLEITHDGKSVADILDLTVTEALAHFEGVPRVSARLKLLDAVGLGYLPLGQPLNTLSGGESQRLKLVKYLSGFGSDTAHALLLLDEPTTGLHRDDVRRLIGVLQKLVDAGHSIVVIEHQMDVIKSADWVIELGPDAGEKGGRIVFEGTPAKLARSRTATAPYLKTEMTAARGKPLAKAAAPRSKRAAPGKALPRVLEISGAREHNLKNISLEIPHNELTVLTGVSGSGKSTLAFDIIFAEGQRRFMESMSPYARQFVEQMPRPDIDRLRGIAPTVAIEQRVTRGTRKSTVATITEVAQYLRLLYSRLGVPHSPVTGEALVALPAAKLARRFADTLQDQRGARKKTLYLCAPLVRGRKGHHEPLANWARDHGYTLLRIDGEFVETGNFKKLDRYSEHDIEVVTAEIALPPAGEKKVRAADHPFDAALKLGKGTCFLARKDAKVLAWFSTSRTDPATGESFPELDPKHFSWNSPRGWCETCRGYGYVVDEGNGDAENGETCTDCGGERLNPVSRAVRLPLRGGAAISLPGLLALPAGTLLKKLRQLKLDARSAEIAKNVIPEIEERLRFMDAVGLAYLSLDRATVTLSGGEAQRIRLAAQLGANLSGVLYVLDEPSIGLHAHDNRRLIQSMLNLRDKGNTLLVVEHDDDTMRAADRIIDLGPGAGVHGGHLLANGSLKDITRNKDSLTARYLKQGIAHPLHGSYRSLPAKKARDAWLHLEAPTLRNLRGDDLHLPLNRLVMVCGISGAGKSTLIRDTLLPAIRQAIKSLKATCAPGKDGPFKRLLNGNAFRNVIEVDQSPIGKTPRSTPATYIGAFDLIREFFANVPEARARGLTASTFSFNTKGGRCETCKGAGRVKLEMNFLPDTYIECEDCNGARFGDELGDIRWKDKTIGEVLAMTFEEAAEFFAFHKRLKLMLELMVETGLGYLTLGQSSPTLSGGEAQRLKLVSELSKGLHIAERLRNPGGKFHNLYILEEPTIGLHLHDCERLIHLLHRLVEQGHTVIVIEHHLDLIAEADYVVELGPEGGERGGRILYQGPVAQLLKLRGSPTAPYLRATLEG